MIRIFKSGSVERTFINAVKRMMPLQQPVKRWHLPSPPMRSSSGSPRKQTPRRSMTPKQEDSERYLKDVDDLQSLYFDPTEPEEEEEQETVASMAFSPRAMRTIVDELWSQRPPTTVPQRVEKQTAIKRLSEYHLSGVAKSEAQRRWALVRNTFRATWALTRLLEDKFSGDTTMRAAAAARRRFVSSNSAVQSHLKNWRQRNAEQTRDMEERAPWFVISPHSKIRICWDLASTAVLLSMVYYIPYQVAFVGTSREFAIFEWFVTVWFSIDIILSFITAYETNDGILIFEPYDIAKHYCRTYLLVDVIATVPFSLLIHERRSEAFGRFSKTLKIPRLLRYTRAFKLIRVYGMESVVQQLLYFAQVHPALIRLIQIVLVALIGVHLFACFWYSLGTSYQDKNLTPADCTWHFEDDDLEREYNSLAKRCTWLQAQGLSEGDGNLFLYTLSLYWTLATVSTIGYGDITPYNTKEMIYTCTVMIAGVAWYSLILTSVAKTFESRDKVTDLNWRTRVLNRFVHKHRIPPHLASAIHSHNRQLFDLGHHWRNEDTQAYDLIAALSKPLFRILALHVEGNLISKIPWFDGKPNAFVADAVVLLQPQIAVAGEVLIAPGTVADAFHVILFGKIAIRRWPAEKHHQSDVPHVRRPTLARQTSPLTIDLGCIRRGSYFGEEGCLLGYHWTVELSAIENAGIEYIKKVDFLTLLDAFPDVKDSLIKTAKDRFVYSQCLGSRRSSRRPSSKLSPGGSSSDDDRQTSPFRRVGAFLLQQQPKTAAIHQLRTILRDAAVGSDSHPSRSIADAAVYIFLERLDADGVPDPTGLSPSSRDTLLADLLALLRDTKKPSSTFPIVSQHKNRATSSSRVAPSFFVS